MQKSVIVAMEVKPRLGTSYPAQFAEKCSRREKKPLGDQFALSQFGVNLTKLPPGCWSSLRHWHKDEDEFVYVVSGELTLVDDYGAHLLRPGMCAGFKAGLANGHHLINRGNDVAFYLEIGSRMPDEEAIYSDVDMKVVKEQGGAFRYSSKNGTPY